MANAPKPESQTSRSLPSDVDDTSRELCLRYLLCELDAEQTSKLLDRLALEPALANELEIQAQLISHLGTRSSESTIVAKFDSGNTNQSSQTSIAHTLADPIATETGSSRLAMFAAIAASLLVACAVWLGRAGAPQSIASKTANRSNTDVANQIECDQSHSSEEELLLARAWADGPLSLVLTVDDLLDHDSLALQSDNELEDTDDEESLDPSDDSVLHWMVAAVQAGENHDG
tara:strand:+ start:53952 stop:54647 length:696 start_codon:yes stop_codon:yes gene_type:complete